MVTCIDVGTRGYQLHIIFMPTNFFQDCALYISNNMQVKCRM